MEVYKISKIFKFKDFFLNGTDELTKMGQILTFKKEPLFNIRMLEVAGRLQS